MCPLVFFYFIVFILFAAVAIAAVAQFLMSNPGAMALLKGGSGSLSWLNNGILDVEGQKVTFVYRSASKNSPSRLHASLTGNFFAHALFRTESQADRLAKGIGLCQEIQLFDPAFDTAVYVECDDQAFISNLLNAAQAKDHLKNILKTFTSLEINGAACSMVKTPCDAAWGAYDQEMTAAAASMVALTAHMPSPEPGQSSATPLTDANRSLTAWFIGAAFVFVVGGIVSIIWGFLSFPPVAPGKIFILSLKVSVLVAGLFVFYAFHALKGTSIALRAFTVTAFAGGIGLLLLGWGGMILVNGSQDVSEKALHHVRIIGKYITHSKNSTSYHLTTTAWDPDFADYRFTVSSWDYDRINMNDPCVITTKSGLLKFEWVVSHVCG